MLKKLCSELMKKGYTEPSEAIAVVLNCSLSTAKRKLEGCSPFTVSEAVNIIDNYFFDSDISVEELFAVIRP